MGRRSASFAASLLLAGGLWGCAETTQQKNARAQLQADRLLASRVSVHVTRPNPSVTVAGVGVVRDHAGMAVAVTLRNDASSTVTDVAISVGLKTRDGRLLYFNRGQGLAYFQTHVAAIAGGGRVTWVFATSRVVTARGTPFAMVGHSSIDTGAGPARVPPVVAGLASTPQPDRGRGVVEATVTNRSGVPQYGLDAYAYALSGGRLMAAGHTLVATLDSGSSTTVAIRLIGSAGAAAVQVDAPPTILR